MRVRSLFVVLIAVAVCTVGTRPAVADDVTVPDVVGLSLEQAKDLLEQSGLKADIHRIPGTNIGKVTSQEPGGLCARARGTVIRLTVVGPTPKPGPLPVPVPPTDSGPAPKRGGDSGLGAPPAGAPPTGPLPEAPPVAPRSRDPVLPQPPPTQPVPSDPGLPPTSAPLTFDGRTIPMGALPNTRGPELPSVLGQGVRQAQRGLARWRVTIEYTLAVPTLVGKVVNQRPHAGQTLAQGEMVTIVSALAKPPSNNHLAVPQVEDGDWQSGVRALSNAGFQPQPFSVASAESQRGRIILQTPMPGSLVPQGTAVTVFIGRGSGSTAPAPKPIDLPRDPTPVQPPVEPPVKLPAPLDDGPPAGAPPTPIDPPIQPPVVQPPVVRPPIQPPVVQPPIQPPVVQPPLEPPQPVKPVPPAPALGSPALAAPPDGDAYPFRFGASFRWVVVSGASAYEWELEEELPSGAWQKVMSKMVSGTEFRPKNLVRGRYRWRVRAAHQAIKGAWSPYRRLYMY